MPGHLGFLPAIKPATKVPCPTSKQAKDYSTVHAIINSYHLQPQYQTSNPASSAHEENWDDHQVDPKYQRSQNSCLESEYSYRIENRNFDAFSCKSEGVSKNTVRWFPKLPVNPIRHNLSAWINSGSDFCWTVRSNFRPLTSSNASFWKNQIKSIPSN